jgi:triosephosphate isomerase
MRAKLVAGNWKMNGSLAANQALLSALVPSLAGLDSVRIAVCPPYPYLVQAQSALRGSRVAVGAQDVSQFASGAYTGEVAAGMLVELGCTYAIVGHSERRALFGDTDELVALKFEAAKKAGLTPILCVGESLAEREAGQTEAVVGRQLDAVVSRCGVDAVGGAVVAYEPVWAIGTGRTATPQQAQDVHAYLRGRLGAASPAAAGVTILYGGSVKGSNAAELFRMKDIDGGLIGGAALDAADFANICRAAASEG